FLIFYMSDARNHVYLHSFPTRRSSDLGPLHPPYLRQNRQPYLYREIMMMVIENGKDNNDNGNNGNNGNNSDNGNNVLGIFYLFIDRKSTRLNSSHVSISYAVFCLKKKN